MRAADNPAREPGIQRGRGGFLRGADDAPYVTDPSGALVKTGARKGQVKRIKYGSPSGFGGMIEDAYALTKYAERYIVEGIGLDPALQAQCVALAQLGREHEQFNATADGIAANARATANHMLAADRGTHMHAVTDDVDQGRDWRDRAADGVALGLSIDLQAALVDCWQATMRDTIEAVAVEAACVDDTWRLAGTLDRLGRTLRPLRFVLDGGEVVDVPAGIVLVVDTKTGHPRRRKHAIQIASYAQSLPYDTETEQRGEWPWPIDQRHALVAHLDVNGALNGNPSCTLVYVDLIAGREHGGATVLAAKAWAKRDDMFSVAQLDATPLAGEEGVDFSRDATPDSSPAQIAVSAPDTSPPPLRAGPGTPPTTAVEPSTLGADTAFIAPPEERPTSVPLVAEPEDDTTEPGDVPDAAPASVCAVEQPTAAGEPPQAPAAVLSPANPRPATEQALSPLRQAQADRARQNAEADARRRLHQQPSEGDGSDASTFASVEARYRQLDGIGQAWIKRLATDANAANVPFGAREVRTARRFSILTALTALARDEAKRANRVDDDWLDETARALLYAIIGDVVLFPTVPLGHLVGSLNATEADTFAGLCTGRLAIAIDDTGTQVVAA